MTGEGTSHAPYASMQALPAHTRRQWRRLKANARFFYWQRLTRRSARLMRRFAVFAVVAVMLFALWNFSQPEDRRVVRRETISREHLKNTLQHRLGHHTTDLRTWGGWPSIKTIFAFGDSYTDTGFNPRGPQPDEDNPMGNPAWPGRTASYGPNYVGHLTMTYKEGFVRTFNFANRNSPFEANLAGVDTSAPLSFSQQIDTKFLRRYGTSNKKLSTSSGWGSWYQDESLFLMYVGMDDILIKFKERNGGQNETQAKLHIEEIERNVEKLYNAGGRNFLFLNYASLEASPWSRNSEIPRSYFHLGADIVHHNGRLAFMAHRFAERHLDANVFLFDQHKMSLAVRRDNKQFPETEMIEKIEGYCYPYAEDRHRGETKDIIDDLCKIPMDHWFWRDDAHHTEPYEQLMARLIVEHLGDPKQRLPLEFY